MRILWLGDIPGYSEFLPPFAMAIVIAAFGAELLKKVLERNHLFYPCLLLPLMFCFIDYSAIKSPQLGVLVGTERFHAFPVVQYFPFFLLGCFFAKHQIRYAHSYLALSIALVAAFVAFKVAFDHFPAKFPPSIVWVASSFGIVYLYYLAALLIDRYEILAVPLRMIGRNVLFWLLISNLSLFALSSTLGQNALDEFQVLGIYAGLVLVIYFLQSTIYGR